MASLDPRWAGGRPRRITIDDESFIVETAKKRPAQVGAPFSHWSLRKLRRWLGEDRDRPIVISKERLRQILDRHEITFQRTKTWKESNDPNKEAKLDRIEELIMNHPDRTFAFDPVRPVGDPPDRRVLLGEGPQAATQPGQLSQDLRGAPVPRLLLHRR